MIDEFQYLNSEIYLDSKKTRVAEQFAAGYMSTAEYRDAPLLISSSYIGWLRDIMHTMLPSRFREREHGYSVIGEVKNLSTKAFSLDEAREFMQKAHELQEREQIPRVVLFVFSLKGFQPEVLEYFREHGIAYSDDDRWLG